MQTKSYISAAALAAALLSSPHIALAQALGLDVDLDVLGIETDADVDIGGESLVDADVTVGSNGSDTDAASPASGDGSLVDIDIVGNSATGPNGGTLIDLDVGDSDEALLDADLDVLGGTSNDGSALLTGHIRIASLGEDARKDALLDLIDIPNLAELDLDAVIDDRRVAIVAAADLLAPDALGDIRAAIELGGDGRAELLDALSASVELGAILGTQGIDLDDVLAVQIAENGAAEVIVLDGTVELAMLGDNGDLADLTASELADLDVDLLSREELAEVDLDLLPDELRTTAQLRLLGSDSKDADLTPGELADIDLDLLSREEMAELDVGLLPQPVAAAVNFRLLGDDGGLADRPVGDLASIDLGLLPGNGSDDGAGTAGGDDAGNTGGSGGPPSTGPGGSAGGTGGGAGDDGTGTGNGGTGDGNDDSGLAPDATADLGNNAAPPVAPVIATLPPPQVGVGFVIASLGCDIGTLALASGQEATPQAIAGADSLELVSIDGCERSLVDSQVDTIRAAITLNPAISDVLDDAQIPLDEVIGATVQDGTLTLFIEPTIS